MNVNSEAAENRSQGTRTQQRPEPSVGVVVATHNRPELMRLAVDSILAQEYAGELTVVVVHDACPVDLDLVRNGPGPTVSAIANTRTPGLAGARNTGILSLDTELVAFCDDDDVWLPGKLRRQVAALLAVPGAEFASTAMEVAYQGTTTVRLARASRVSHDDFLRSRMAMVHSSSFLIRRDALQRDIGLVDESIPNSMCEDWDLLLRASRRHAVVHVDQPLIRVLWGASSYFYQQWSVKNAAHQWMLEHHPDILTNSIGVGRVYGQLAFGHAAMGKRREAVRWAAKSLRANWREPRAFLALAVASGLVSDRVVVDKLQQKGRGI